MIVSTRLDEDIRARSGRLRAALTLAVVLLSVLVLLERGSAATLQLLAHGWSGEPLRRWLYQLAVLIPDGCYLLALWWIRQAIAAFADGDLFGATIRRMLGRVGAFLAIGALLGTFALPAIAHALALSPGYWIAIDVSGLVLGAIGLALGIVARVLARAAELQSELDGIF